MTEEYVVLGRYENQILELGSRVAVLWEREYQERVLALRRAADERVRLAEEEKKRLEVELAMLREFQREARGW
jgi:hypothetical protein